MKFRKKPIVINAWQTPESDGQPCEDLAEIVRDNNWDYDDCGVVIPTLEGEMLASPGDWIIQGVSGEYYPCKPEIFAATYEAV
ncbi:MAG: hypothetical protein P1U50_00905 [Parvibaculaceae bacterium]|nr:hypothetical protein [Parvibaculaceae bacterium]